MPKIELKKIIQLGIVVPDASAAAQNYQKIFGVPADSIWELNTQELEDWHSQTHKGKPVNFNLKVILFNFKGIQFELIEPLGGDSNCYSEFLERNGPGIQHVFVHMDDYENTVNALEKDGAEVLTSGHMLGADYKYFDFTQQLGLVLETAALPDEYVQTILDS